jgi:hypothetical protein
MKSYQKKKLEEKPPNDIGLLSIGKTGNYLELLLDIFI